MIMFLKYRMFPMFPKDVPEVPEVPDVPELFDVVWQKQRMTFAKQHSSGDPDPPVEYSLTKF
jgi:hypothetical protein